MKTSKRRGRPAKPKTEEIQAEEMPQTEKQPKRVYILRKCANPDWVSGSDEDQNRCNVKIPRKVSADRIIGKWVLVTKIDGEDETLYTYLA